MQPFRGGTGRETEFRGLRSQTEFGNEVKECISERVQETATFTTPVATAPPRIVDQRVAFVARHLLVELHRLDRVAQLLVGLAQLVQRPCAAAVALAKVR